MNSVFVRVNRTVKCLACVLMILIFMTSAALPVFSTGATAAPTTQVPTEITSISSRYVTLIEASTGRVLYGKRAEERAYPASTTKILTAIIAIEKCAQDELVTLGNNVEQYGSRMGLSSGETLTMGDLIHGMMMVSGNDAARAIAEHISGTRAEFAVLMNEKAAELGMTGSHFANPNGLDSEDHYSSAHDLAIVAAYAMKNDTFREIVSSETYNIAPTNKHSEGFALENTNRLIHMKVDDTEDLRYQYATGVKTGDTEWAGRCIVAAAKKDNMELIAVLLGDFEDSRIGSPRYKNAKALFEYGFANYSMVDGSQLGISDSLNCDVSDGIVNQTTLKIDLSSSLMCVKNDELAYMKENAKYFSMRTSFNDGELKAPLEVGQSVGYVEFVYNGEVVLKGELTATENIDKYGSGNSSPGEKVEEVATPPVKDNSWLFWLLAASLFIVIIIVMALIRRRGSRQLRRSGQLRTKSYRAPNRRRY